MPGLEKKRFLAIKSDLDEFICGICQGVFVDPLVTQCCRQTYCSDCITHWLNNSKTCPNDRRNLNKNGLSSPPRALKNLLDNLLISCENLGEGCKVRVKLGELDKHMNECEYRPNSLCKVCHSKRGRVSTHNCVESLLKEKSLFEMEKVELDKKMEMMAEKYQADLGNFSKKLNEFVLFSTGQMKSMQVDLILTCI